MDKHKTWEDAWAEKCAGTGTDPDDLSRWGFGVGWLEAHATHAQHRLAACRAKLERAALMRDKAIDERDLYEQFVEETNLRPVFDEWKTENVEDDEPDDRHEPPMSAGAVAEFNRGQV